MLTELYSSNICLRLFWLACQLLAWSRRTDDGYTNLYQAEVLVNLPTEPDMARRGPMRPTVGPRLLGSVENLLCTTIPPRMLTLRLLLRDHCCKFAHRETACGYLVAEARFCIWLELVKVLYFCVKCLGGSPKCVSAWPS